jgi:hypothetical protein
MGAYLYPRAYYHCPEIGVLFAIVMVYIYKFLTYSNSNTFAHATPRTYFVGLYIGIGIVYLVQQPKVYTLALPASIYTVAIIIDRAVVYLYIALPSMFLLFLWIIYMKLHTINNH